MSKHSEWVKKQEEKMTKKMLSYSDLFGILELMRIDTIVIPVDITDIDLKFYIQDKLNKYIVERRN